MREDILLAPAGEVEPGAGGQEAEAGGGEFGTALAGEPRSEALLERVQMEDVGGGVGELRLAQRVGGPVGTLLHLRELDIEEVLDQVLEPVPVGVGTGQLG